MAAAPVKPFGPTMQPTPQKPRPTPTLREPGASPKRPGRPGAFVRVVISLLIVWHFAGVFLAALSIPTSSQLVMDAAQHRPMQWYLDALYMNQGHSFFAPEVGPGHLIRYELFDQSGQVMEKGEFPKDEWPRLRYHRHFMLADQADMPGSEESSKYWQRRYLEAYARQLLRTNEIAQTALVRRIAHWPLPRELALQQRTLTDPEGYELLMEVTQRRSDLGPEETNQSLMWQGGQMNTAGRWNGAPR
ncbi:MAG: hypothetical protein L0228_05515 [Planctomycetes bacterium]|nr:hypothetical protein [Planctomycetota bacterium]